ncbi:hypothetical protein B0I27_104386 [Arcticibacter pallidicorallinus]|uniref:Uncharacterized protein n=1 Tax=Arcticibacter pallidicorallinus TaxID=1259464 RepID=A0A2T0U627_9SPHI|nr:hypothetical protein [Arcticibacter pallidicorallinus]PRY53375.1 hypothetical protein B0I27_104386 [Arcticibacter pallidicorallinus]
MPYSKLHKENIETAITNLNEAFKKMFQQGTPSKYLIQSLRSDCLSITDNMNAACSYPYSEDSLEKLIVEPFTLEGLKPLPLIAAIGYCFNELMIIEKRDNIEIFKDRHYRNNALEIVNAIERG